MRPKLVTAEDFGDLDLTDAPISHSLIGHDQIFYNLWWAVVTGQIPAASFITERVLAELFEVSRTPMRLAVARLEAIGILHRQPNRTLRVASYDMEEVVHLSHLRERLEGLAAGTIARQVRKGSVDLCRLKEINDELQALASPSASTTSFRGGIDFHAEILHLCESEPCVRALEATLLNLKRYLYLIRDQGVRYQSVVDEHNDIISAIERGDVEAAEMAARWHVAKPRQKQLDALHAALSALS